MLIGKPRVHFLKIQQLENQKQAKQRQPKVRRGCFAMSLLFLCPLFATSLLGMLFALSGFACELSVKWKFLSALMNRLTPCVPGLYMLVLRFGGYAHTHTHTESLAPKDMCVAS